MTPTATGAGTATVARSAGGAATGRAATRLDDGHVQDRGWPHEGGPPFDLARAYHWVSVESYWGAGIPRETFEKAVAGSLTIGVYAADAQ
ncbi:MAG: hypothetical protein Q8N10_10635 [Phenylobacterium sp.]|uniref:hypothetical protein n=1 Tax=Phenylobacterium sp. TaxID=1871053 RepID=UPI00272578DB|nr:hypothetical protein [Phenylobacterium sp.]MDO8910735.1 hypothetical protein [Phenylobacterium sp.]MDP3100943.1 hypothetical protein [Phenylobacterium sp.]